MSAIEKSNYFSRISTEINANNGFGFSTFYKTPGLCKFLGTLFYAIYCIFPCAKINNWSRV